MSIHDGHRERLRKELLDRPGAFPDHKALEALLFYAIPRSDTNELAHRLIDRFGSLAGVLDARPEELMKVPGVGERTVGLLKVTKEMTRRYLKSRTDANGIIRTTADAYRRLWPVFFGARNEIVAVLCLDAKGKELGVRVVSEGSVNAAQVITRSVAEAAFSLNAVGLILAHNHPSGLALPSDEDKATTQYLSKVLQAVGVSLRDHLIFVDDDMVSMRDSGFEYFY